MRLCYLVLMYKRIFLPVLLLIALGAGAQPQTSRILSVTFEGNKSINSLRLKREMRLCREGAFYQPDALKFDLSNLEKLYQEEGFLKVSVGPPKIQPQSAPLGESSIAIVIPVSEGPLFNTGEITIKNVQAFDPHTLVLMCPLKPGEPFSRQKISDWLEKIAEGYHTMGYLRFAASVKENLQEQRRVVDCMLDCREGNVYSVGKITVQGDESIDRSDFRKHLLIGEGGLFNSEMIFLSLQFINQMGKYKPISEADVEMNIDDAKSTVDLVFHVIAAKHPAAGKRSF